MNTHARDRAVREEPAAPAASTASMRQARMRSLVDEHTRFVTRTLRRAGVPGSEVEDEVQRTFIVAAGRLDDVQPGAERSFLFQVALNTAAHKRRSLARCREFASDHLPERSEPLGTPEDLALRQQTGKLLEAALAVMSEPLRCVLVLYEVEEMDSHEISALLHVPRGTVASRLRRARMQLRRNLAAIELAWDLDIVGKKGVEEPAPLREERVGPLARALLGAGAATPASKATRAKTLVLCLADLA
jgi:RNA polymerase sigma-70 factor (ECF subfamily)